MASTLSAKFAGKLMGVGGAAGREGVCLVLKESVRLVVSHGFKFDLANRRPVPEEKGRAEANEGGAEKAARPKAGGEGSE